MLTPIEIREKKLRIGIGYDRRGIDVFFKQLTDDYEKMYRENIELKDRVANMASIIQNYKTVEKSMQKALVLAEKSSDETKEAARAAARSIEEDARANALLIVASAEQEKQDVKNKIVALLAQYDSYKSQYKHLLESQLELLNTDNLELAGTTLEEFVKTNVSKLDDTDKRFAGNEDNPDADN
ncbi:MAG: DivIVA domain-containing protein [Lachnospiraceae bacterium]|nr:DivIVA domain-containing protein [Lachnospiraceae bacterium]